jgi:hypothetical protein
MYSNVSIKPPEHILFISKASNQQSAETPQPRKSKIKSSPQRSRRPQRVAEFIWSADEKFARKGTISEALAMQRKSRWRRGTY